MGASRLREPIVESACHCSFLISAHVQLAMSDSLFRQAYNSASRYLTREPRAPLTPYRGNFIGLNQKKFFAWEDRFAGITIVRYTPKRYSVKFYLTLLTIRQRKIAVQGDCVAR